MLRRCFEGVSKDFPRNTFASGSEGVSKVFWRCFEGLSPKHLRKWFRTCFEGVSREFRRCFGGISKGVRAGFDLIWANDIDPDSCDTHSTYFGIECKLGNIDELLEKIPNGDVLIGGPPCQSFSLVGKRYSDDPRGQLIKSFIAAVGIVEPKIIVMENVPGMLSAKPGNIKVTVRIKKETDKIKYYIPENLSECVFDLSKYGVPQKRKRVIIFGVNKKLKNYKSISKKFYETLRSQELKKIITVKQAIGDLDKFHPLKKITKIKPRLSTTGGTSDARFIRKISPCLEFGLVGKTMHKVDEVVALKDLKKLTLIYSNILENYFK